MYTLNFWHIDFLDPVSIGFNITNEFRIFPFIIPDGNVINHLPPRKRGIFPFLGTILSCYSTRGHENLTWEIPNNSSFNPIISVISPYRSVLRIGNTFLADSVERFVCRSSNNISSSVIISNSKFLLPQCNICSKYAQCLYLLLDTATISVMQ